MKSLGSLNKYFVKYKWRLLLGLLFVTISCLFAVIPPVIIRNVLDQVPHNIDLYNMAGKTSTGEGMRSYIFNLVFYNGILLLVLALLRSVFMFMMRQTLIVMSRLIEYDQKSEIYNHYQQLDTHFYKIHYTGDLMNRIAEDVSRVRMYTGPSIMYAANVVVLTVMCVWGMLRVSPMLTLYVVVPLPILAITIYYVNKLIYRKSSKIQAQLSALTITAQESYSGIRVIKSFVQEQNMRRFFETNSEDYRKSSINLAKTEAFYFPAMNLFIGLSMLSTTLIGGIYAIQGRITTGNIAEFVVYINLLMFPISSIGMVASMIQRAGASQQRINEFLHTRSEITDPPVPVRPVISGEVAVDDLSFTYQHTGVKALNHFSMQIRAGQKVAIVGKTGSGKSTLAHLLLRMYDAQGGSITMDGIPLHDMQVQELRRQIGYAPQEPFLFSDTVYNNIRFGRDDATEAEVKEAARLADMEKDIATLAKGYETVIGERGVMLSGGQKQRMALARALLKNSKLLILDGSLSAVDTQTEKNILRNLESYTEDKTAIIITHRIFTSWTFDQIILMDNGAIAEQGTHAELMAREGRYAKLYRHQTEMEVAG
ncbi:MAG: ABC transporter ATP-binding protein [Taibaiella sp.]|nr:ABC transporter ATP-binding protein [Taibaiella sp.]